MDLGATQRNTEWITKHWMSSTVKDAGVWWICVSSVIWYVCMSGLFWMCWQTKNKLKGRKLTVWFVRRKSGRKQTSAKASFNVNFPQSKVRDTFPNSNTGLQDCLPFLKLPEFVFALYLRCTCSSYISCSIYMLNGIFVIKHKNNHRKILIMLYLRLLYKSPSVTISPET